jgi:hypothetical protein
MISSTGFVIFVLSFFAILFVALAPADNIVEELPATVINGLSSVVGLGLFTPIT